MDIGTYVSVGNVFTAVYWSNNYYLGYGLGMVLSGAALIPISWVAVWHIMERF